MSSKFAVFSCAGIGGPILSGRGILKKKDFGCSVRNRSWHGERGPLMNAEPERQTRSGIAAWFAPLLGILCAADAYLYETIVCHQEFDAFLLVLFGGVGGLAGVVMLAIDKFRRGKGATEPSSEQPSQHTLPHASQDCELGAMRKAFGAGLVVLCLGSMILGRFVIALFYREFAEGGLTVEKLKVLIPIWSVGLLGLILWLTPSRARFADAEKNDVDDSM
jgi:hypothetical protein